MRLSVLAFLLLFLGVAIVSCDSSGIAGSGTIDNPARVVSDTIVVDQTFLQDIQSFSGGRTYMTAGKYNDHLYGKLDFTALILPGISRANVDSIESSATMSLRFVIDQVYGNRAGSQQFELVELERRWRSRSWRLDSIPPVSNRVLATFTVPEDANEIIIPLHDNEWVQRYRGFFQNSDTNRDSLYVNSFFGLAIVPVEPEEEKLLSFAASSVRLLINNNIPDVDTVYSQTMRSWGYSKVITPPDQSLAESSVPVFNNFKNNFVIDLNLEQFLENTGNISRAELVLYEDTLTTQSTLPDGHLRSRTPALFIYLLTEAQSSIAVTGLETFTAVRRTSDASWRFNITNYVRSQLGRFEDDRNFFVKVGRDDGRFFPYLIHTPDDEYRYPKIIITRIIPEE